MVLWFLLPEGTKIPKYSTVYVCLSLCVFMSLFYYVRFFLFFSGV